MKETFGNYCLFCSPRQTYIYIYSQIIVMTALSLELSCLPWRAKELLIPGLWHSKLSKSHSLGGRKLLKPGGLKSCAALEMQGKAVH